MHRLAASCWPGASPVLAVLALSHWMREPCPPRTNQHLPTKMRPAGFRLLAERVAQTEALAVEAALARASTDAQKVEALMNALDRLQEARDNTALHVTAGAAGGEVLTADSALLDAHLDMLDRLARKYGVEDCWREALQQQHDARLASKAGVWGSGIDGAPLERLTCANIRVHPQHVCTGPASFVCG